MLFYWLLAATLIGGCVSLVGEPSQGPGPDSGGGIVIGDDDDDDDDHRPPAGERGYQSRPCGFDLDFDGIPGEPGECDFCDGVTQDPDGDGVDEDLIYVNCDGGNDGSGTGSPSNPYRTLRHAISRMDGPDDGAEDIICFRGTCDGPSEDNLDWPVSGLGPGRALPIPENGKYAVEAPDNPTMLIGWDTDNDGRYPPFDNDDKAVLDGDDEGHSLVFALRSIPSYLEMAHFRAQNYGANPNSDCGNGNGCGFLRHGVDAGDESLDGLKFNDWPITHRYFHDLELHRMNYKGQSYNNNIVFSHFRVRRDLSHVIYQNLEILDTASYGWRGNGRSCFDPERLNEPNGHYRMQNITLRALGCKPNECNAGTSKSVFQGTKLWACDNRVEFVDSVIDANADAWNAMGSTGTNFGIRVAQCQQDWHIANNQIRDFRTAIDFQVSDSSCNSRPIKNVSIQNNDISLSKNYNKLGTAIKVEGCNDNKQGCSLTNLEIWGNRILGGPYAMAIETGNGYHASSCDNEGEYIRIRNNIFSNLDVRGGGGANELDESGPAVVVIGTQTHFNQGGNDEGNCIPPNVEITGNVFSNISAGGASFDYIDLEYQPAESLLIDENAYDAGAVDTTWRFDGDTSQDFSSWRMDCNCDANSEEF